MEKFDLIKWILALSAHYAHGNKPFERFSDAAHNFYCFVYERTKNTDRGVFPSYYEFMDNVRYDLANDRCGTYPDIFEKLSDYYSVHIKHVSPSEKYIAAAKAGAVEYIEKCDRMKKANAETQKILANSTLVSDNTIKDYIKYFHTCKQEMSETYLYIALLNWGFMQGVRYERSRRNGKKVESWGAFYTGSHHKKRYNVFSKAE